MVPKHQRQSSSNTENTAAARRRELTALQVERHREQQRERELEQLQLRHGVNIFQEEFYQPPPVTRPQVGIRVQGLTLPQAINHIQEQQGTTPTPEHTQLYSEAGPSTFPPDSIRPLPKPPTQAQGIARFFTPVPVRPLQSQSHPSASQSRLRAISPLNPAPLPTAL